MAKFLVLQHHPSEHLGRIAEALEAAAQAWQYLRTYDGQRIPRDMKGAAGLILMGGPMGVYEAERYPFLGDEMALIESALKAGKPVLGVCLGSQLLAAALGARVYKGERAEIGWHQLTLSTEARSDPLLRGLPETFTPCHWHGDIFDLPQGAIALASSAMTRCRGFVTAPTPTDSSSTWKLPRRSFAIWPKSSLANSSARELTQTRSWLQRRAGSRHLNRLRALFLAVGQI